MARYVIWSIDAWADGEGGWTCNDRFYVAEVEMPDTKEITDADIINTLYEREIITTNKVGKFHIWDLSFEPLVMQVNNADTEEPLYEIMEVR